MKVMGSYVDYYKRNADLDSRLAHLDSSWFNGKRCLDIGTNEGRVSLKVAEEFKPAYILGIDVDKRLIDAANSFIKRVKHARALRQKEMEVPVTSTSSAVPRITQFIPRSLASNSKMPPKAPKTAEFPDNVEFRVGDFFDLPLHYSLNYDTVLCLSVSKWIHLNEGDRGLIRFMHKVYCALNIGGIFVFEYQHWKSYLNKKSSSARIKEVFPTLRLRPECFERILLEEFGFELVSRLGVPLAEAQGYHRPILVLRKIDPASRELKRGGGGGGGGVIQLLDVWIGSLIDKHAYRNSIGVVPRMSATDREMKEEVRVEAVLDEVGAREVEDTSIVYGGTDCIVDGGVGKESKRMHKKRKSKSVERKAEDGGGGGGGDESKSRNEKTKKSKRN